MTVLDNTPRDQYTATASQTVFPYTFEIAAIGDIKVLQNGVLINQGAGAGEYGVSGVGVDTGGNVTLVTGATAGDVLTLYRDMALNRLTSYNNAGDFLAADVNNDFDRLWLALQQNTGNIDRALVAPDSDPTNIDMTIPDKAARLDKLLKFNVTTGNPEVISAADALLTGGFNVYNFTGTGAAVAFTLGQAPGGENNTQVYIDGVYQQKDTYSVSSTTLTFSTAPPNLSTIEVMVIDAYEIGSTTAAQVSFTQSGSTYGRNVQLKLEESVSVEDFGAVGDGVTDDSVALQNAFTAAVNRTLVFPEAKTYLISSTLTVNNVRLKSNGSRIKSSYDGYLLDAVGTLDAYYNLSENAYQNAEFAKCTDATLLASLSPGDMVKIISNEIGNSDPSEQLRKIGETIIVREVDAGNNIIYFQSPLFDTYFTTDTARIAKVNYVTFECIDQLYVEGDITKTTQAGIRIKNGYKPVIKGTLLNCWRDGVVFDSCFSPIADRVDIYNSSVSGNGVAMHPINATVYASLSGNWLGSRHAFTSGGNDDGGYVWGCHVHDAVGQARLGVGVFDTHASSGSHYFENVVAEGGITSAYDAVANWNVATAYTAGNQVFSPLGRLYEAVASTTGNDPDADLTETYWEYLYGNDEAGFAFEGRQHFVKNCTVRACESGVSVGNTVEGELLTIDGLNLIDVRYGVTITAEEAGEVSINNVVKINSVPSSTAYCVSYGSASKTIDSLSINNIFLQNCPLLDCGNTSASTLKVINVSNVYSKTAAQIPKPFIDVKVTDAMDAINLTNVSADKFLDFYEHESASTQTLKALNVNGGGCRESKYRHFYIDDIIDNIYINSFVFGDTSESTRRLIYINAATDLLSISNCDYQGTNVTRVLQDNTGVNVANFFHSGNNFDGLELYNLAPDIEILSGSLNQFGTIRIDGTPEAVITANPGTLCLRRDGGAGQALYVKESGTGNTGWVAK